MENLQKEMNILDLRFEDTGFHELKLCESRCNQDYSNGILSDKEKSCYGIFQYF